MTDPVRPELIADLRFFASGLAYRSRTPLEHGVMKLLMDAATELESLAAASVPCAASPADLGKLRTEIGTVLRQVELTTHRADALPPATYSERPTIADWRERVTWLVDVLNATWKALELEHLAQLRTAAKWSADKGQLLAVVERWNDRLEGWQNSDTEGYDALIAITCDIARESHHILHSDPLRATGEGARDARSRLHREDEPTDQALRGRGRRTDSAHDPSDHSSTATRVTGIHPAETTQPAIEDRGQTETETAPIAVSLDPHLVVAMLAACEATIRHLWDIAGRFDTAQCNKIRDEIHRLNALTLPAIVDVHDRAKLRATGEGARDAEQAEEGRDRPTGAADEDAERAADSAGDSSGSARRSGAGDAPLGTRHTGTAVHDDDSAARDRHQRQCDRGRDPENQTSQASTKADDAPVAVSLDPHRLPYDFDAEARIVCEAIGSNNGWMTVNCALHEAYEAGARLRGEATVRPEKKDEQYASKAEYENHMPWCRARQFNSLNVAKCTCDLKSATVRVEE
jgi:hypothetical protein